MPHLARRLRIHPGEGPTVARLIGLNLVAWTGFAIGGNAIESLFFSRFGTASLPTMYIGVGLITFPTTVGVGALLARPSRRRILTLLPLAMGLIAVGLRALLAVDARWVYPPLWLTMMALWIVLGIDTWSLAGMVHDTRQAKRLFPLYGTAVILGAALGGLATAPLAAWLHAENLVLVWAVTLGVTTLFAGSLSGAGRVRHRLAGPRPRQPSLVESILDGYRYVRGSALLRWMSLAALLLSMLYFSLSLPFAQMITARYPDPDRLAGFLGLFGGVANIAALLASLLLANRLFSRLGTPTVVLGLPVIYAAGFLALALAPGLGPLVGLKFAQFVFLNGIWLTGWQALRGVVAPERREQVRAFMDGGPTQVGVVLAGLLLLAAQAFLTTRQMFLVASVVGLGAAAAGWRVRRSYRGSLVDALRAGWPEVFAPQEHTLGDGLMDQAAREALTAGLSDPDPMLRRVAMEIAAELPQEEDIAVPVQNLTHEDPGVRLAAAGLARRSSDPDVIAAALDLLDDPDPEVRAAAADAAGGWAGQAGEVATRLRPLLSDPSTHARVRAAVALARLGQHGPAGEVLTDTARSPDPADRAAAVAALGDLAADPGPVLAALADPAPEVRRAAARAAAAFGSGVAADALLESLEDEDPTVGDAAARALASLGGEVAGSLIDSLRHPFREASALAALLRLPSVEPGAMRSFAHAEQGRALRYHGLWQKVGSHPDERVEPLAAGLRFQALLHAGHAVQAVSPPGQRPSVEMAMQGLTSRESNQRANALEMLEAMSERALIQPMMPIWEPVAASAPPDRDAVRSMLADDDPWIRACAAHGLPAIVDGEVVDLLAPLTRGDPDPTVREVARAAMSEDGPMQTRATLSLMDRVMALRKVPLFRELAPADLKHVAEAATEHVYVDGTVIAEQGDPGDAMHVVVSGQVRVLLGADGRAEEVARRGPGYTVGEMSIVGEQPRMANLVADGDVRTLSLDRSRFQRILRERPDAALAVMRELSVRLREAHDPRGSGP